MIVHIHLAMEVCVEQHESAGQSVNAVCSTNTQREQQSYLLA